MHNEDTTISKTASDIPEMIILKVTKLKPTKQKPDLKYCAVMAKLGNTSLPLK